MSRPNYSEKLAAEQRRAVLQVLIEDGGQSNERTLFMSLRAMGLGTGLEPVGVRTLVIDLEASMCVTKTLYGDLLLVAKITDRGRLAVAGDIRIDGIAPPSPVL